MLDDPVIEWSVEDTELWLRKEGFNDHVIEILCQQNDINGKCLLVMNEHDFNIEPLNKLRLKDRKCLYLSCKLLQRNNHNVLIDLGLINQLPSISTIYTHHHQHYNNNNNNNNNEYYDTERISPAISEDGRYHHTTITATTTTIPTTTSRLPPEKTKAFLSFCYVVVVTWITAFVMVIVHDRVPDMQKYPPLPDIFLDNVPHIPWAFDMCEVTGTFLFTIWLIVLLFHKHRFILMRRFFALSGTVFLLRCVTMLITSLSVPGQHLDCHPRNYTSTTTSTSSLFNDLATKLSQAYIIWRGAGMSIQGVRTCGDYMFSGHTVALTMLNFFITEYTPRFVYYLHTLSWMMNMFGIFFILAAHEHYSIDVFVAFYITSRLFLYYHTLANNQALMQRDSNRTKIWFPMFSYFESSVDGIVPNEYETPKEILTNLCKFLLNLIRNIRIFFIENGLSVTHYVTITTTTTTTNTDNDRLLGLPKKNS